MSNYNKERRKQKGKKSKIMLFIMCVLYLIEIYVIYKKKKEKRINRGLFFSINRSFRHIGEKVKLDIPKAIGLHQKMTRNNEDISPRLRGITDHHRKEQKNHL